MKEFKITGGCQCGAIRYTVDAPARSLIHCHCSMCRKLHGALFVTFSEIPRERFRLEEGAENIGIFDSSERVSRHFCKTCGSNLYCLETNTPDYVYLSTGTIDDATHPGHPDNKVKHIFVGSMVGWYEINDNFPRHEEF